MKAYERTYYYQSCRGFFPPLPALLPKSSHWCSFLNNSYKISHLFPIFILPCVLVNSTFYIVNDMFNIEGWDPQWQTLKMAYFLTISVTITANKYFSFLCSSSKITKHSMKTGSHTFCLHTCEGKRMEGWLDSKSYVELHDVRIWL